MGFMHGLSAVADLPDGVVVSNLAGLPITHRSRVRNYLAQAQSAVHCPNTSGLTDVAVVWVPRIWWLRHRFICYSFLLLVRCPRFPSRAVWWWLSGSAVTLIEEYTKNRRNAVGSRRRGEGLLHQYTEIWQENAQVSHTRVEQGKCGVSYWQECDRSSP